MKTIPGLVDNDRFVHMSLEEGEMRCSVFIFDCDEELPNLAEKVTALVNDEDLYCEQSELIALHFKPSSLLEYYVDGHALYGDRKRLDEAAKPAIDQLRKELQAMIDQIDSLTFAH